MHGKRIRSRFRQEVALSKAKRVLVVDDHEDAAEMLGLLIERLGFEVRTATDGNEALAIANEFHPEIVIMDIGMPIMDGYETARQMRLQPWAGESCLVALTGWCSPNDVELATQAGFDRHIAKPAGMAELKEMFKSVQGGKNERLAP